MRQPKEIPLAYMDLLHVLSALKTEAKDYRSVDMKKKAHEITKTRKIFKKIQRSCRLGNLKIVY